MNRDRGITQYPAVATGAHLSFPGPAMVKPTFLNFSHPTAMVKPTFLNFSLQTPLKGEPIPAPRLPPYTPDAMFHSTSSSSYSDAAFLSSALFSATAPDSLPYDANGCLPPFLSSSPPYPPFLSSSPPYAAAYQLHRSRSTHSLPLYHHIPNSLKAPPPPPPLLLSSPPSSSSCDYLDLHAGPLRRVLSTGDLKGMNALCDNYSQDGASVTAKVGRYSAEERKERIERYRSKRNQRNFHKKITYACRKTLADSRPRVRGRFARNGEMEAETETEIEMAAAAISVSYDNYEDKQSCGDGRGDNGGDLWSHVQAAMVEADDGECCYYEDVLAIFADDFSMNPLS